MRFSATTWEVFLAAAVTFAAGGVCPSAAKTRGHSSPRRAFSRAMRVRKTTVGAMLRMITNVTGNLRTSRVRKFQPKIPTRTSSGSAAAQENTENIGALERMKLGAATSLQGIYNF